jgi:hypothetical protein
MRKQLQAIITVLPLINPAICAAMFAPAVAGQSPILTNASGESLRTLVVS